MKDFFKSIPGKRSAIALFSWIIVIVYAATSINLLLDWYRNSEQSNPREPVIFATVSFLLVVLIAVYHLSSLIRRRRRRSDRQRLSRAKFVRAKHRLPPRSTR